MQTRLSYIIGWDLSRKKYTRTPSLNAHTMTNMKSIDVDEYFTCTQFNKQLRN